MRDSVSYGERSIDFELRRSDRKTLAIEVHPDSSVHLIAPPHTDITAIKQRLVKRGRWILKQQAYFETFLPHTPSREYVSGETHRYLGRRYVLKVQEGNKNTTKLKSGRLVVTAKNPTTENIKKILAAWYYEKAKNRFERLLGNCLQKFRSEKLKSPSLGIKRMEKRWGSCTRDGKIFLNPELIKANSKCIEYVIIHELCHLIIPSHNQQFYALLSDKMPDWERWKERLERSMA